MTVLGDAGVVVNWPAGRGGGRGRFGPAPGAERGGAGPRGERRGPRIEEFFAPAAAYARGEGAPIPHMPTDIRLEAMRTASSGRAEAPATRTTFINAQEYDQILAAAGFATRLRPARRDRRRP